MTQGNLLKGTSGKWEFEMFWAGDVLMLHIFLYVVNVNFFIKANLVSIVL